MAFLSLELNDYRYSKLIVKIYGQPSLEKTYPWVLVHKFYEMKHLDNQSLLRTGDSKRSLVPSYNLMDSFITFFHPLSPQQLYQNIFLATSLTESMALIVQECKHFTDYKKGINAWN